MTDYAAVFETMLQNQLRSPAAYDKPNIMYVQSLVIAFNQVTTDRELRMKIIRELVGRNVPSTKDLKVAEIATLHLLLENGQFIKDIREEYNIQVKGQTA